MISFAILFIYTVFRSCNIGQDEAADHELGIELLQEDYKTHLGEQRQNDQHSSWQMLCLLAEVPCAESASWARERDLRKAQWHM